jgi:hypothetical protein
MTSTTPTILLSGLPVIYVIAITITTDIAVVMMKNAFVVFALRNIIVLMATNAPMTAQYIVRFATKKSHPVLFVIVVRLLKLHLLAGVRLAKKNIRVRQGINVQQNAIASHAVYTIIVLPGTNVRNVIVIRA